MGACFSKSTTYCGAYSGVYAESTASSGGRILSSTSPSSPGDGQMAPRMSRKYLVCFYCNKKSGIRYDGLITLWECASCTSTNFLDENGEIADPPVSTLEESSSNDKYSYSRTDSPPVPEPSSQGSPSSPFCATCLKNQHLFIASLQQFHIELDPSHPEYKQSEKKYYKYRKQLEQTYPQVCEDCWPNVQKGLENAHKTSKSDIIRRSLSRSKLRVRKAARGLTVHGTRDFVGRSLWYLGLLAQLLWHIIVVSAMADHHIKTTPDHSVPRFVSDSISAFCELSLLLPKGRKLGRWGMNCCLASLWWSPRFNNLNIGFTTHITGYKYWYKHQLVLLLVRGLFYFVMANDKFTSSLHPAVGGAHLFMLVFVTFLVIRAHTFIKIDYGRLWTHAPTKLPHIGPGSSPYQNGETMLDAVNELRLGSSRMNSAAAIPSTLSYKPPFTPKPYMPGSISINDPGTGLPRSLKELNVSPNHRFRTSTAPLFSNLTSQSQPSQPFQLSTNEPYDGTHSAMDWTPEPSQPKSKHRAFTENLPTNKNAFSQANPQEEAKLFGDSPVDPEHSLFWYKRLPPAPIAPAHRLRNPPNQLRLRTASQETKENFFNNSRSKVFTQETPETTAAASKGIQVNEVEFTQQKLFVPEPPSLGHDDLVSAFSGWSLGDSDEPQVIVQKSKARNLHVGQGIALAVALIFWNQDLNKPSEYTTNIALAILVACFCIGARTVLDNTINVVNQEQRIKNALAYAIGSLLGSAECSAAFWGITHILGGHGCDSWGLLGTILTGTMLTHELWQLLFV